MAKPCLVIGGGVVGIGTAWALKDRGYDVTVLEAQDGPGLATSYANGGMLTAGMSEPWNAPGVWRELLASLFDPKSAMKLNASAVPGMMGWGLKFLAQSRPAAFEANAKASFRLCHYSTGLTTSLINNLGLQCDYRTGGDLKVFPDRESMAFNESLIDLLGSLGLETEILGRDGVLEKEPTLSPIADQIGGGIFYPSHTEADAHLLTTSLSSAFVQAGGRIETNAEVQELILQGDRCVGARTNRGKYEADIVILCAANGAAALARPHGVKIPIKGVKGYSLTFDAAHASDRPSIAVINQAMHAAVNPLGDRIRVAGTAEFTRTTDPVLPPARIENLFDLLRGTFPRLSEQLDPAKGEAWCGFRPMTFDAKPLIGPTKLQGLYANTGHGYLGLTQSAGAAQILCDLIEGKDPAIDAAPYAATRF